MSEIHYVGYNNRHINHYYAICLGYNINSIVGLYSFCMAYPDTDEIKQLAYVDIVTIVTS